MTNVSDEELEKLLGLVERLARKVQPLSPRTPHEELVALGNLGLAQALATFDVGHDSGAKLATWVYWRARGAIIDGIRKSVFGPVHKDGEYTPPIFLAISGAGSSTQHEPGVVHPESPDEIADLFRELAQFLSVATRRTAHLHFIQGLTVREISADLSLSAYVVSGQLRTAREMMALQADKMGLDSDNTPSDAGEI